MGKVKRAKGKVGRFTGNYKRAKGHVDREIVNERIKVGRQSPSEMRRETAARKEFKYFFTYRKLIC
jgi:hypothetical protein